MNRKLPPEDELRQYTKVKQQLGDQLRGLLQFFQKVKAESSAEQCRALLVKLAEDRFNLAVVGQFKRGKTSLMNAIIGRDLLPTGLLPLTSAITTLCYGPQDRAILKRQNWILDQEIPISDLLEFVTEQGNPGNEKGVIEARIETPNPFLRRGLHFIDTPGIGSSRQENTATTYAFLPEADAVIFVTSVDAPMSEAEEKFIRDIYHLVHKLFVVVNKMDLLADEERGQILNYVQEALIPVLGDQSIRIYPLSAHIGLKARLDKNDASFKTSGLELFETDLASFLNDDKSQVFLISILDRAERLIQDFEPGSSLEKAWKGSSEIDRLLSVFITLRKILDSHANVAVSKSARSAVTHAVSDQIEQTIDAGAAHRFEIGEQPFPMTRTCPVCAVQSTAVFDFFVHWQYILSTDPDARRAFRLSRGFCRLHTWQFQQIAAPQGISEGYAPVVENAVAVLRAFVGRPVQARAAGIAALLPTRRSCPACHLLRRTEETQIFRFLTWMERPEGREGYKQTLGLCLPHLQFALAASPSVEIADLLMDEQANHLEEISEDMHSYVLKRDALRRGLLNENEAHAWQRALVQLVGEKTSMAKE